jgi:hypothetical protein
MRSALVIENRGLRMHAVSFRSVILGCCVLAATAACGSSGTTGAASDPTASSTASASRTAYVTCLREHGAVLPTAQASPGTAKQNQDPASATARADCASLKPAGRANGNHKNAAVEAFDACMKAHGETIPTQQPDPTASPKPTGVERYLHGLNPDSAAVAAALKACESDLPSA